MTARIKHVSDLPKWFNLDKYKKAKKLDAAGWHRQLAFRGKIVDSFYEKIEVEFVDIVKSEISNALNLLREKPILDDHGEIPKYFSSFNEAKQISQTLNHLPALHPMTLEQFALIKSVLNPKRVEYVKLWLEQFEDDAPLVDPPIYKYEPWIRKPLSQSTNEEIKPENNFGLYGMDPVIVDLNYPDKILLETFKQYLATRRAESKTEHLSKPLREQDFYDWCRFGVLPYLDLKLWEMETGNKIPLRVLANAIYPSGEGGEETVRKTTAPLAKSLIEYHNLRILVAQVATELVIEKEAVQ